VQVTYNVQVPPRRRENGGKSEEVLEIESFLTSGNAKNMCFEYEDTNQAKSKLSTVKSYRRREGLEKSFDAYRVDERIYIVRVKEK